MGEPVTEENTLARDDRPRFFEVADPAELGFVPPAPRRQLAVRTYARALVGMQKEAVIVSSATGRAWRLVSDEGPYLNGYDEAPFPLAFMGAGMAASYWNAITATAGARGAELSGLRVSVDNRYTMEGSALRGTMTGGALPPELHVAANGDPAHLDDLCAAAVDGATASGLVRGALTSQFTLTRDGQQLPVGRVSPLADPPVGLPGEAFGELVVGGSLDSGALLRRRAAAELHEGEGGAGSSLQAEQKRSLHLRSICTASSDGGVDIEVQLFRPSGSTFLLRADEASDADGAGRAPDAATLLSAGVGFCFLTQIGRYAAITKRALAGYGIVQDTHFDVGIADGFAAGAAVADPVETHVHIERPEDDDFARTLVDMGEQTCFLHALCRTSLEPDVRLAAAEPGERLS